MPADTGKNDNEKIARSASDEDKSHELDVARTKWESEREHDSGTGSPHAKEGKLPSKSQSSSQS